MSANHTPEPLKLGTTNTHHTDLGRCNRTEICSDGVLIAHSYADTKVAAAERARRIVACVNACAGVSTEMLEGGAYLDAIKMQRDALAAALRDARNELADLNQQEVDEGALIERLDALLSKF